MLHTLKVFKRKGVAIPCELFVHSKLADRDVAGVLFNKYLDDKHDECFCPQM